MSSAHGIEGSVVPYQYYVNFTVPEGTIILAIGTHTNNTAAVPYFIQNGSDPVMLTTYLRYSDITSIHQVTEYVNTLASEYLHSIDKSSESKESREKNEIERSHINFIATLNRGKTDRFDLLTPLPYSKRIQGNVLILDYTLTTGTPVSYSLTIPQIIINTHYNAFVTKASE